LQLQLNYGCVEGYTLDAIRVRCISGGTNA
jgi:hypothetical protein